MKTEVFTKGYRHKETISDLVTQIKNNHTPSSASTYIPQRVSVRNENSFYSYCDLGRWDLHSQRRKANLRKGFFTQPHLAYKPVGEPVLDVSHLVIDTLRNSLREQFVKEKKHQLLKLKKIRLLPEKEAEKKAPEPESSNTTSLEPCHLEVRKKKCRTAGMKEIRGILQETKQRRIACRAGQDYAKHVQDFQEAKEQLRLQQAALQDSPQMALRQLSSHHLRPVWVPKKTGAAKVPEDILPATTDLEVELEPEKGVESKRNNFRRRAAVEKLESIYILLCSLHNMKSKHLRQRTALNFERVKALRRDPFTEKVGTLRGDDRGTSQAYQRRSVARSSVQFSNQDIPRSQSGFQNPSESEQIAMSSERRSSIFRKTSGGEKHTSNSTSPHTTLQVPSRDFPSRRHLRRKMRSVTTGMLNEDNGPVKLEDWEDLLHVSHQNKSKLNRYTRKIPPWQQQISSDLPLPKKPTPTKEDENDHIEEYHPETSVGRFKNEFVKVKEKYQAAVQHEIEKQERERMLKFRYKLRAFDDLPSLFEQYKEKTQDMTKSATKDPVFIQEESSPWFELLNKEIETLGLSSDPDVGQWLSRLQKFMHVDDTGELSHVKEKLCLLAMSLPVTEMCTPHMQNAMKFVLESVLNANPDLMNHWLAIRKLYVI